MPLCPYQNLSKMNLYRRDFDKTKYMYFLIKDNKCPEKYNEIWDNISQVIKQVFDCEPTYNEKYLKTKIKSYEQKVITNYHNVSIFVCQ